ncbi:uncharacterized protein LOC105168564 [Sesamum indicum]|uniref:Uncharacterized protein LOC105168564 n=1 Tax=Sesamum indicum TaxID=4182 RepID=A0A6I9TQS5_SESIN|nr:uncharacterized protein LOC105168564 [Sesamum indicum]
MPLEDIVKTLPLSTQKFQQETRSSIQNVESQMSQLASSISRLESQGIKRAMYDLGASINVMPLTIFKSLNVGPLKETGVVIQLADRSIVYPEGVLEDVLVEVNELVFPADFFVIDMREDNSPNSTSILLGRPFLKTARTKIDVHNTMLPMEFDGTYFGIEGIAQTSQVCLLRRNYTLSVIISSKLFALEEKKLIRVLREFREIIGWT